MKVIRQFVEHSVGQMHLRSAGKLGDRSPIVCLHMMPKSSRGFAKLLSYLGEETWVVAPDYPGYGESDVFTVEQPTIADYADSIAELISSLELAQPGQRKVNLLGYHTGSMIAVELATRYPDLVNQLACISAPVFTQQELQQLKQFFQPIPLDKEGTRFSTMWSRVVEFSGPGMSLEMAAESMAENLRAGDRYEQGHTAAFNYAPEFVVNIAQLAHRILVLNIGDDLFTASQGIVDHLGNGEYLEIPEWGHGCLELWPKQVAQVLIRFFQGAD